MGEAQKELHAALDDRSPSVRVAAAQALGQYGDRTDLDKALPVLLSLASCEENSVYVSLAALNAIDALGQKAAGIVRQVKALPTRPKQRSGRAGGMSALIESFVEKVNR